MSFFYVEFSGNTADLYHIEGLKNSRVKIFDYLLEEEGSTITLLDLRFEDQPGVDFDDVINKVFQILEKISSHVVCLFEGNCGVSDDLISEDSAKNIYAFQSPRGILNGTRDEIRLSKTWIATIRAEQRSLKSYLLFRQ